MVESKIFFKRYIKLCKKRNVQPIQEIKQKMKNVLEFFGDRIKLNDWLVILECLQADEFLVNIAIRIRKAIPKVYEKFDSEKKVRLLKDISPIATNFLFRIFVFSISELLRTNPVITTLSLEGLPLSIKYIQRIVKGLSQNISLQKLSFARSALEDEGCEVVCATLKHLPNIEHVSFNNCKLGLKGAEAVSELIKYQKIYRYSEGWRKSLRYKDVDPDSIPGIKSISLNNNVNIGDEGIDLILEILKEDVWIKTLCVENCGLTDKGGHSIVNCLEFNKTILDIDLSNNQMSEQIIGYIRRQLGHEPDDSDLENAVKLTPRSNVARLNERIAFLEEQLENEMFNRKQVELLNEQLHKQMMECQKETLIPQSYTVPDGYTLIQKESLDRFLKEVEDLRQSQAETSQITTKSQKWTSRSIHKAKSELLASGHDVCKIDQISKSECVIKNKIQKDQNKLRLYIEKNIGDSEICGTIGETSNNSRVKVNKCFDPMSLFMNSTQKYHSDSKAVRSEEEDSDDDDEDDDGNNGNEWDTEINNNHNYNFMNNGSGDGACNKDDDTDDEKPVKGNITDNEMFDEDSDGSDTL